MIKRVAYLLFTLFLSLYTSQTWAGCSEYIGLASINEVSKEHPFFDNVNDFIEVKRLDKNLNAATISSWNLEICETIFTIFLSCSGPLSLSSATQTGKYLTLFGSPNPSSYIDWQGGFDVVLRDENDDVIDYLTVNNITPQYESCDFSYPITATGSNSTRRTARSPDGVGEWNVPPGNSLPPTGGEDNESNPPPEDAPNLEFLEDVIVVQGETASLTFVLNTSYTSDVTINYATVNGNAIAGIDYQSVAGTVIIPAGKTSRNVDVNTILSGNVIDTYFFMSIESAVNADVVDQVAKVTILQDKLADHFSIQHPGLGVNCEPSEIIVTARDNNGDILFDYTGTIQLSIDTSHGDWSLIDGQGSLLTGSVNSGMAQYTFAAEDRGQVILGLSNSYVESININIIDATGITESSNNAQASDDEDLTFQQAAFHFLYDDGMTESQVFPDFVSHKPLSFNLSQDPIKLKAITTDINTGECVSLFNGPQSIELALSCSEPNICDGSVNSGFSVDGISLAENSGDIDRFNLVSLDFDANGVARLPNVMYQDVGRVELHARKVLTGSHVLGSSNELEFFPAGFCLSVNEPNNECVGASDADLSGCSAFKAAGEYFSATISAQGWERESDINFCDNNARALSFNHSTDLEPQLKAPILGDAGYLNTSATVLTSGANTLNIYWSEVGVLNILMGGNNYLNGTLPSNSSDNIGRFIPGSFRLTKILDGTFSAANDGFSYIGQTIESGKGAIRYQVIPQYEYVALNALAIADTLQNYIGDFNKNPQPLLSITSTTLGADGFTPLIIDAAFLPHASSYNSVSDRYTMTFSELDHFSYMRNENSRVAPFVQDAEISMLQFEDADGVGGNTLQFNPDADEVRYGRIRVLNGFGSEIQAVDQSLVAEYFDGQQFQLNPLDNNTQVDVANVYDETVVDVGNPATPLLLSDTSVSGSLYDTGFFQQGLWNITWSAPLNGHYGEIQFIYSVPEWLTYNWDDSVDNSQEDPKASVSFGQYRGHDNVIYWKELYYK